MAAVQITPIVIYFVALILSFPGNVFIIVVNIVDFCRRRRLAVSDRLICGFSVFCLLHGLHEVYSVLTELHNSNSTRVSLFFNMCTLWFSALLSIHFCLKIVTINHWFYICLQRRFPKMFPWITLTFLLELFFLNLYSTLETKPECLLNTTTSQAVSLKKFITCFWLSLMFQVICVLCAFLCSVSASTILISLLKHKKRIQENTECSGSPNIEAHARAVRTVTTLLVTSILLFISVSVVTLMSEYWVYLFYILIIICHIFSSYFLIKGTKKLDKKLNEILTWCSCISCKW